MSMSIELQILGIAGVLLHYFKLWVKANNDGKEFQLKKSIPNATLSAITTGLLIYLRADIENIYVVTPVGAVVLGYIGSSAFFSIIETRKPKLGPDDSATAVITKVETPEATITTTETQTIKNKQ